MNEKRFTRAEVIKMIHDVRIHYVTQLDGVALCDKTLTEDGFCDYCLKEKCDDVE